MKTHHLFASSLLTVMASAGVLLPSGTAAAAPAFVPAADAGTGCASDADCTKGLTCQSEAVACPAIACAPNEECELPPGCGGTPGPSQCVPGPCTTDSDCGEGLVCYGQTYTNCSTEEASPPCPAGEKCPASPVVDAGCTTTTTKTCVPKYVPPCQANADCGPGFTCTPNEECYCSGSGGSAPSNVGGKSAGPEIPADDAGATATPPACGCSATGTSSCVANTITCTSASDCPAMWTCAPTLSESSGCAVAASADGGTTISNCEPTTSTPEQSVCQPPYANIAGGTSVENSGSDTSAPVAAGSAGGTAESSASGSAASPAASSQGGCQVTSGSTGAGAGAWVGLFGLAAFASRRRKNRG